MPVIPVTDHTLGQTDLCVRLTVPLHGERLSAVDLFASPEYLKVSFPPRMLELFWSSRVRVADEDGRCVFSDGRLFLELRKEEKGTWEEICKKLSSQEKAEIRTKAQEIVAKREADRKEGRLRGTNERSREATMKALEREENRRREVSERKEEEKERAMEEWDKEDTIHPGDTGCTTTINRTSADDVTEGRSRKGPGEEAKTGGEEVEAVEPKHRYSSSLAAKVASENERLRQLPPPRSETRVINVDFSASRAEKMNAKESRLAQGEADDEEGEAAAEEMVEPEEGGDKDGTDGVELTEEEEEEEEEDSQPAQQQGVTHRLKEANNDKDYLLRKGHRLFQGGSFGQALEVFAFGIKMHPKHAPFYNNRSACRLKVGDLRGSIEDASRALELLGDGSSGRDHAKALARRGAALAQLGLSHQALGEFEAAMALVPDDEGLRSVREELLTKMQQEETQNDGDAETVN